MAALQHRQLIDGNATLLETGRVYPRHGVEAAAPHVTGEADLVCRSPGLEPAGGAAQTQAAGPQQQQPALRADGAPAAQPSPATEAPAFTRTIGPVDADSESYASVALIERIHNAKLALFHRYEQRVASQDCVDMRSVDPNARREFAMSDEEINVMITSDASAALRGNLPSRAQIELALQRAAGNGLDEILAELDPTTQPAMRRTLELFVAQRDDSTVRQHAAVQHGIFEPPEQFAQFWTVQDN